MVFLTTSHFLPDVESGPLTMEFREDVAPAIAVLSAALLAFYSFVGFETSANLAEEVKDVRRTYPRALFGALLTAGGVYVAVGIAAVAVVDPETLSESTGPLLEVVHAADVVPDRLFAAVALIAVANGALLTMIMASRLTYGMASQELLPPVLARVLPGRKTPWAAILVTTLAAIALVFTGELQVLAETVVLLLLIVFISTNIAVLGRAHKPHKSAFYTQYLVFWRHYEFTLAFYWQRRHRNESCGPTNRWFSCSRNHAAGPGRHWQDCSTESRCPTLGSRRPNTSSYPWKQCSIRSPVRALRPAVLPVRDHTDGRFRGTERVEHRAWSTGIGGSSSGGRRGPDGSRVDTRDPTDHA